MDNEEIPLIPKIPTGLREAAQLGTLIPFVGAGASRIAGCPGWSEFADGALKCLISQGKLSHGQLAQLNHLTPRVKLSIALGIQNEHKIQIDFREVLHPSGCESEKGQKLFSSLSRLGKVFVTTNYDEWLDKELIPPVLSVKPDSDPKADWDIRLRNIVYKVEEIIPARLNQPNTVIHLHGSLRAPGDMVVTTRDYIKHYANDRSGEENPVLTFLEKLFEKKTVFFIGYGLEELEILEYVVLKSRNNIRTNFSEPRHYILQGFFSYEQELMRSLKWYYKNECGIQLIPFSRDQKDWNQLLDVLEEFARSTPASAPTVLQDFVDMEDFLDG